MLCAADQPHTFDNNGRSVAVGLARAAPAMNVTVAVAASKQKAGLDSNHIGGCKAALAAFAALAD